MDEVFKSLRDMFEQPTAKRLLFWLFIFLVFYTILALAYNHWLRLVLIDQQTSLLERLHQLEQQGIEQSPALYEVYKRLLSELQGHKIVQELPTPLILFEIFASLASEQFWKFFSGGLVFILVILYTLLTDTAKPLKDKTGAIFGSIVLGLPVALVAANLPTIYNPWINYIGVPLLVFLILWLLGRLKPNSSGTS